MDLRTPEQQEPLTDTYVQQVPDKCDRIVWRGNYYHLPIAQQPTVPQGLIEAIGEASVFIHAVHTGEQPNVRYPLTDELDGFAAMLSAALAQQPTVPYKMEIPPAPIGMEEVCFADGWNAACDAFFGGLPPPEPLIVIITETAQ